MDEPTWHCFLCEPSAQPGHVVFRAVDEAAEHFSSVHGMDAERVNEVLRNPVLFHVLCGPNSSCEEPCMNHLTFHSPIVCNTCKPPLTILNHGDLYRHFCSLHGFAPKDIGGLLVDSDGWFTQGIQS